MTDYRYHLTRESWIGGDGRLCWAMMNPSTADDTIDDATIRRVIRFTQDHGYASLVVVNLFAARSTEPDDLLRIDDPIGPQNAFAISCAVDEANAVVFAWGGSTPRKLRPYAEAQAAFIAHVCRGHGHIPLCLDVTASGEPRHPLYMPAATRLRPHPTSERAA